MKNNNKITESLNINSKDIDVKTISDMISIFNNEDLNIINSIKKSSKFIEQVIVDVVSSLKGGGRLFYVGAGTSGRLGVMDAAECRPTFGIDKDLVQGVIAGGEKAMLQSIEGAEDSVDQVLKIINEKKITNKDVVIGISCSGEAKFVLEFRLLEYYRLYQPQFLIHLRIRNLKYHLRCFLLEKNISNKEFFYY